jgi:antitoxin (DNA-binding transcriptional repressor) of toxin-antitoxin stability system
MKPMTARELKNSTGEVVRTLRRGESILLTFRGKALGTIEPLRPDAGDVPAIPPYEEAWAEIEAQSSLSKPRFTSWQDAEAVATPAAP